MNDEPRPEMIIDTETTALLPFDGRLTVIACVTSDQRTFISCDQDEAKMLREFVEFLDEVQPIRIFGFNVGFDLRWIYTKCLQHKISMPVEMRSRLIDLRKVLGCGEYQPKGTLNDYAKLFGFGEKLAESGKAAIALWQNGQFQQLMAYCMQDVKLTAMLVQRMQEVGVL